MERTFRGRRHALLEANLLYSDVKLRDRSISTIRCSGRLQKKAVLPGHVFYLGLSEARQSHLHCFANADQLAKRRRNHRTTYLQSPKTKSEH